MNTWSKSSQRRTRFSIKATNYEILYDEFNGSSSPITVEKTLGMRLKGLWRKIMKEKRKVESPGNAYDPGSYAQNFDEGPEELEPAYLPHSFSARYARPSKMFGRRG
ncbi:hypothetical protein J5N97_003944 [Dioscorea zingiberensis]|uniref:Uncharacterized protein n=1 Tax=Dioscorea zingiberensis TaxID=325984 RepID=A0A9D5D5P2_9LILI|nr:hypothetical protein J5N97_003944 [Dioscorea zingiberensis]